MNKYVAFIDILGFKERIKDLSQYEAESFITDFSKMIYQEWENCGNQNRDNINGFIVSDCIIVHTTNEKANSLELLLDFLIKIYKRAFCENGILLRGAIAKGQFEQLRTFSFKNLQKGLIVGQAYIDAFKLESSYKGSLIMFNEEVKKSIQKHFNNTYVCTEIGNNKDDNSFIYSLRWADIDYLMKSAHFEKFVDLAVSSDWLPHYYQTLYLFLTGVDDDNKKKQLFVNIINYLKSIDGQDNSSIIDVFIKKGFHSDVDERFHKLLLSFLKESIYCNLALERY